MKNRYGSTDEVGVFEMHDDGLQVRSSLAGGGGRAGGGAAGRNRVKRMRCRMPALMDLAEIGALTWLHGAHIPAPPCRRSVPPTVDAGGGQPLIPLPLGPRPLAQRVLGSRGWVLALSLRWAVHARPAPTRSLVARCRCPACHIVSCVASPPHCLAAPRCASSLLLPPQSCWRARGRCCRRCRRCAAPCRRTRASPPRVSRRASTANAWRCCWRCWESTPTCGRTRSTSTSTSREVGCAAALRLLVALRSSVVARGRRPSLPASLAVVACLLMRSLTTACCRSPPPPLPRPPWPQAWR